MENRTDPEFPDRRSQVAETNLESEPKATGVLHGWPLLGLYSSPQLSWPKGGQGFPPMGHQSPTHGTLHGELSIPISSSICGVLAILGPCAGNTLHLGKGKQPRRNSKLSKPRLISSPVCIPHPASPSSLGACCSTTQRTPNLTSLSVGPGVALAQHREMAEDA